MVLDHQRWLDLFPRRTGTCRLLIFIKRVLFFDCDEQLRSTLEAMRQLSFSAPSAINLDMTTVKFEEEISMHNVTIAETASDMSDTENSPRS